MAPNGRGPARHSMRWRITGLVAAAAASTAAVEALLFYAVHQDSHPHERLQSVAAGVLAAAVASGLAWVFAGRLVRPLERLRDAAAGISRGDLSASVHVEAQGEIGDLATSFEAMALALRETLGQIREAAATVERGASEILGSVTRQAARTEEQATAMTETSATASDIAQTSQRATRHADSVIEMTQRSDDLSREGLGTVEQAVAASASLGEQVNRIAATMNDLTERTLQVGEIVASVKDLAEASNLLALNASIEASRAGEHGRGFATVALEMRTLAEQSKQAAVQVRAILQEIQRGAREAAAATEEGAKRATAAVELARSAGEAIEGLAGLVAQSALAARQIAASTRQQTLGVEQMVRAIGALTVTLNETAAGTKVVEQGTAALTDVSRRLHAAVQRYRV